MNWGREEEREKNTTLGCLQEQHSRRGNAQQAHKGGQLNMRSGAILCASVAIVAR